jgi:hypothetical protein
MARHDIQNDEMVDPLIFEMRDVRDALPTTYDSPDTVARSSVHFSWLVRYNSRSPPARAKADMAGDDLVKTASSSLSNRGIGPIIIKETATSKAYLLDKPLGFLSQQFAQMAHFNIILKESYRKNALGQRIPDEEKIARNGCVGTQLFYFGQANPDFPRVAPITYTERRIIAGIIGKNMAHECTPAEARILFPQVRKNAHALAQYFTRYHGMPKKLDYEAHFLEQGNIISQWIPEEAREEYLRELKHDAKLLGRITKHRTFVPHGDNTSLNFTTADGVVHVVDWDKNLEQAITSYHNETYMWADPTYDWPFDAVVRGIGSEGMPDAYAHTMHRIPRALGGRLTAPLPEWIPGVMRRFEGYIASWLNIGDYVQGEFHTPRFHHMIDFDARRAQFARLIDAESLSRH